MEDIRCKHVFSCDSVKWRSGEPTDNFKREINGKQFENLFKSLPTIEIVFNNEFTPYDFIRFMGVVESVKQEKPETELNVKSLENEGFSTILKLTIAEEEYFNQIAHLLASLCKKEDLKDRLLPIFEQEGIQLMKSFSFNEIEGVPIILRKLDGETIVFDELQEKPTTFNKEHEFWFQFNKDGGCLLFYGEKTITLSDFRSRLVKTLYDKYRNDWKVLGVEQDDLSVGWLKTSDIERRLPEFNLDAQRITTEISRINAFIIRESEIDDDFRFIENAKIQFNQTNGYRIAVHRLKLKKR